MVVALIHQFQICWLGALSLDIHIFNNKTGDLSVSPPCSHMEGGVTLIISRVFCHIFHNKTGDLSVSLLRGLVEGGVTPIISRILLLLNVI